MQRIHSEVLNYIEDNKLDLAFQVKYFEKNKFFNLSELT